MKQVLRQTTDKLDEMMRDSDSKFSSKRAVGIVAFIMVIATWVANLFFQLMIQDVVFNGLIYIVGIALTTSVAEKFTKANMLRAKNHVDNFMGKNNNDVTIDTDIDVNVTTSNKPTRKLIK